MAQTGQTLQVVAGLQERALLQAPVLRTAEMMQVRRPDVCAEPQGPVSCSPLLLLCPDRPTSDTSPTAQKKVIDRLRSPGTVRKLSLKMKKLPELRRKLSLRSSSRSHRQETDGRGGDAAPSGSPTSAPVSSNQNVLSRYHLDSSAPPARAQRRPASGRSGSKGGEVSASSQQL